MNNRKVMIAQIVDQLMERFHGVEDGVCVAMPAETAAACIANLHLENSQMTPMPSYMRFSFPKWVHDGVTLEEIQDEVIARIGWLQTMNDALNKGKVQV